MNNNNKRSKFDDSQDYGGLSKSSGGDSSDDGSLPSKQFGRVNRVVLDKNSDEYKKRRERNNMAVKKSRTKSKLRTQETMQKVTALKEENERLEQKVKLLSKELSFLKDLFLTHANSSQDQTPPSQPAGGQNGFNVLQDQNAGYYNENTGNYGNDNAGYVAQ